MPYLYRTTNKGVLIMGLIITLNTARSIPQNSGLRFELFASEKAWAAGSEDKMMDEKVLIEHV